MSLATSRGPLPLERVGSGRTVVSSVLIIGWVAALAPPPAPPWPVKRCRRALHRPRQRAQMGRLATGPRELPGCRAAATGRQAVRPEGGG